MNNELIADCAAELDDDLPYLRHPAQLLVSAVTPDPLDRGLVEHTLTVVQRIAGVLLFTFVVVPAGLAGKLVHAVQQSTH